MRRIDLETGDINTNKRVFFHLAKGENVYLGYNALEATFPVSQWQLFLDQLNNAFRPRWYQIFSPFDRSYRIKNLKNCPTPPLGSKEMKEVINGSVTSTPKYQLFLAAVDLTSYFLFEKNYKKYSARCLISVGQIHSKHGGGGIFLIDDEWLGEGIEELLDGNRLCKVTFDYEIVRYYIPYAVPFKPALSKKASYTWDKIRNYKYAR